MEVILASGLEIAYERVGVGPPLVFVHGSLDAGTSNIEQPTQFNEAVREFCRTHPPD